VDELSELLAKHQCQQISFVLSFWIRQGGGSLGALLFLKILRDTLCVVSLLFYLRQCVCESAEIVLSHKWKLHNKRSFDCGEIPTIPPST